MHAGRTMRVLTVVAMVATGVAAVASSAQPAAAAAKTPIVLVTPNGPSAAARFARGDVTDAVEVMGLTTQQLSISTSSGTFATNCGLQMTLLDPEQNPIVGPVCAGTAATISVTLPEDGLYTARLTSEPNVGGTVVAAATSSSGPATITPGADAKTFPLSKPGSVILGFAAHAGEHYSAVMKGGNHWTRARCTASYEIVDSNGAGIGGGSCGFIDATTIPRDGDYFLEIRTDSDWSGYEVLPELFDVIDPAGTLVNGTPVAFDLAAPGAVARYTFHGSIGNRVATLLNGTTIKACTFALVRPDASIAMSHAACGAGQTSWTEPFTLDQTGTWTIVIDPSTTDIGMATLERWGVVDQTGSITADGTPLSLDLSTPGKNASETFSGTTGQRVSVYLSASTIPAQCSSQGVTVTLVRPDGTTLASTGNACSFSPPYPTSAFIAPQTLDQSGTWTVVVDPTTSASGTATLQVSAVVDQTGTTTIDGAPVNIDLSEPGQNASITFSGSTGQNIATSLTPSSIPAPCTLSVLRPDGGVFQTGKCASPGVTLGPFPLDATGTWTIVVDPGGPGTGTATLQLQTVVDQTGSITPGGPSVAIDTTTPGQNAAFTFSGTTGDHRTISVTASTFPGCSSMYVSVLRPDGSRLSIKGTCGTSLTLGPVTLDATGTWTILVDPQGSGTGTATLTLT